MSLGLLNPAGALALLAVAALVILHLYERRRRVIPSATLFLWQRLPASNLERERLRTDLLFVLQLLLLLALIGGYVRPYARRATAAPSERRLLLVLDRSASMQAREAEGTRFELARRRARALVAELGAGDEAMLVVAAERAQVVLGWTAERARLEDRLETLEALDLPTNLAPALELALGEAVARPGTRVAVLTDLPPAASGLAEAELGRLDWVQIGTSDDNVALAGLTVEQPPFREVGAASATVLVRSYARVRREVVLEAHVDGEPWARRTLALAPRTTEHVRLTAPPRAGELVLTLVGGDALPADDRAVGWIAPAVPLGLLVVSESARLAAAFAELAGVLGGARIATATPSEAAAALRADQQVVLFDGVAPSPPPAVPAVYLAPPAGNTVCPSERTLADAAVVDWEDDHPVLDGIGGLEALAVTRPSQLALPEWGSPIVLAAAREAVFPLLIAGERASRRSACLAAALHAPLTDSDQLPLLLVTLAALRWVAEPSGTRPVPVRTGVPAPLDDAGAGPAPAGLRLVGDPPVVIAERAGRYRLGTRLVLANLFDDRESDIGRDGGGERRATRVAGTRPAAPPGGTDLSWWLYLGAAGLLVIEWIAWRRRAVE